MDHIYRIWNLNNDTLKLLHLILYSNELDRMIIIETFESGSYYKVQNSKHWYIEIVAVDLLL
jgi:hypothetical protein